MRALTKLSKCPCGAKAVFEIVVGSAINIFVSNVFCRGEGVILGELN
jgi:hypothetical protein